MLVRDKFQCKQNIGVRRVSVPASDGISRCEFRTSDARPRGSSLLSLSRCFVSPYQFLAMKIFYSSVPVRDFYTVDEGLDLKHKKTWNLQANLRCMNPRVSREPMLNSVQPVKLILALNEEGSHLCAVRCQGKIDHQNYPKRI